MGEAAVNNNSQGAQSADPWAALGAVYVDQPQPTRSAPKPPASVDPWAALGAVYVDQASAAPRPVNAAPAPPASQRVSPSVSVPPAPPAPVATKPQVAQAITDLSKGPDKTMLGAMPPRVMPSRTPLIVPPAPKPINQTKLTSSAFALPEKPSPVTAAEELQQNLAGQGKPQLVPSEPVVARPHTGKHLSRAGTRQTGTGA